MKTISLNFNRYIIHANSLNLYIFSLSTFTLQENNKRNKNPTDKVIRKSKALLKSKTTKKLYKTEFFLTTTRFEKIDGDDYV